MAAVPTDWTSLLTNVAAPLGGKILGDQLAPDASLQNAQNSQNSTAFSQQMQLNTLKRKQQLQSAMLPGMFSTLGYTPDSAKDMANSYAGIQPPSPTVSPSGGSSAAKTALGAGLSGLSTAAPYLSKLLGGGIGAAAPTMGAIAGGIDAAAVPDIGAAIASAGGLGAEGAAGAGATAAGSVGGGGGGILSSLGGMSVLGPAALIGGGLLATDLIWKHYQAHPTADKWVQGAQNPFDKSMAAVDQQVKAGSMTPQEAAAAKQQNAQEYLTTLQKFSQQGQYENQVARQAADTFRQYYGDPAQYGVKLGF